MTTMNDSEREAFEAKYEQTKAVVFDAEYNRYVPRHDSHWQRQCAEAMTPAWRAFQAGAAWQRAQGAVPEGWKLVPVEPTPDMLDAGKYALDFGCYASGIYAAILAAAHAHPAERQEQGEVQRLREALENLAGAARSINVGRRHKITVPDDDQPVYWQREEWVRYVLRLVYEADAALAASTGQEVES